MRPGNVYHAIHDGTCILRFEGAIDYTLGSALDRFLDRLFARDDVRRIIVDLTPAESIDSTGLGLLARIANFARRRDGSKPLLFSTDPDINLLLHSICLDDFFVLCAEAPAELAALSEGVGRDAGLDTGDVSESELARTVLAAHRLLC